MKILFIEQHSMKLGDRVFYSLEHDRQNYLYAAEASPYLGLAFGFVFFVGFAYWTPLSSKLYKESALSLVLGMVSGATYPFYYRRKYLQQVDEVYADIRHRLQLFPHLNKPDTENAVKNFGNTRWNDEDFESGEEIEMDEQISIFDGDDKDLRKDAFEGMTDDW